MGRKQVKPKIAVLGAGAAGLSAAYGAQKCGFDVDVFEARDDVGGMLRSARINPFETGSWAYDVGAASMTLKYPEVARVVDDLTISSITRDKQRKTTYVVHNGETVALPRSPQSLIFSPLLDAHTKWRVFMEPFAKRSTNAESVYGFFSRRFSEQFAARIIDPAIAGIYAASPKTLLMEYALPSLWKLEKNEGSVIIPMLQRMFKSTPESKKLSESRTFPEGMQSFPRALANALNRNSRLFTNTPVSRLRRNHDGTWKVNRRWDRYDAIICALPAHVLPSIGTNVSPVEKAFARITNLVHYAPMAVAVLGFSRKAISHALDGVGVLVSGAESRNGLLGVQFSSEGFPSKRRTNNEQDMVYLTAYVGGARKPKFARQPVEKIEEGTIAEVSRLLGVSEKPSFTKIHVWESGIPQPNRNQLTVQRSVRRLERSVPGLVIAGNYVNGVGVPDAVLSGLKAAKRVQMYMSRMKLISLVADIKSK